MIKKMLLLVVVAILFVFGYYYSTISTILNTATGFAAKNLCSGHYNSGYALDDLVEIALIPANPAFEYVSYVHNKEQRVIETSLLGLKKRKAQFRDGMGCSLMGVGQEQLRGSLVPPLPPELDTDLPWPDGLAAATPKDYIDYGTLENAIDDAFRESSDGGLRHTKAVVVIHNGELIAEQYAAPITRTTPSLSWSMAKSITNLLAGTLVERDQLDIMAPAPIDAWKADDRSKITTDMLLRMSSGLAFNETYGINTDVTTMLSNAISASDYAIAMPLAYPVDSHWAYSSGTSNIVARIVFDAIGGDLQAKYDYANEALFAPLKLQQALMETDGSNVFIGSSYFYATPLDWAKLGQLTLQDGVWNGQRLLPEGWVEYSHTPTSAAPNREYGAHFWLNAEPQNDRWNPPWPDAPFDAYFMSGYQGQFVIIIPSKELVVVRLGYSHPGTDEGINELLAGIIAAIDS